jgi:Spy/CpxP family protein refolding chaperone
MDYEKKYKWTLAGLLIMVIINAVTLITIWNTQSKDTDWRENENVTKKEFGDRNAANKYFKERLNLTDSQSDSIIALRRKHFGQMHQMREELETTRKNYFDSLIENKVSQAELDSMVQEMAKKSGAIERLMSKHMLELNKKLNQQQQREFAQMMQEMFQHQRGRNDQSRNENRPYRHRQN